MVVAIMRQSWRRWIPTPLLPRYPRPTTREARRFWFRAYVEQPLYLIYHMASSHDADIRSHPTHTIDALVMQDRRTENENETITQNHLYTWSHPSYLNKP